MDDRSGDRKDGGVRRRKGMGLGTIARRTGAAPGGAQGDGLTGRLTRVALALEVLDDFDRFFDHMARFEVEDAASQLKPPCEEHERGVGRAGLMGEVFWFFFSKKNARAFP